MATVKLEAVELRRVALPLVTPFRTSFGLQLDRDALLVRVITDTGDGWGECVAMAEPLYSSEYADGAQDVMRSHLIPRLFAAESLDAAAVKPLLSAVKGHPMAKAALEMAVLDAELRAAGQSFGERLGATREAVDCGVSIGIFPTIKELIVQVDGYLDEGYKRIKLKIEPGWDYEPVRAVRERWPDIPLQVDANTAYSLADEHVAALKALDEFDLLLVEQPLPEDDVSGHAVLAQQIATPICLDESILSAESAADAIARGACSIVNIKAGRVGGYLEAVRVHDVCQAAGVAGVVRRHARDRPRPRRQCGPRRAAGVHPPGRHLGLRPLLRARHHRAVRPRRRAAARAQGAGSRRVAARGRAGHNDAIGRDGASGGRPQQVAAVGAHTFDRPSARHAATERFAELASIGTRSRCVRRAQRDDVGWAWAQRRGRRWRRVRRHPRPRSPPTRPRAGRCRPRR